MSNMAEVNGTDHLVRHEKETKQNGYYNEGYDSQERSLEDEESASDEDRLRIVVTENGHRPQNDPHLHNGHIHDDQSNDHSTTTTTVNGTAIIVMEEGKEVSNVVDSSSKSDDSSQKPLDTRLHHFVPVDDIDRKILNGSDGTRVTIPEDAVISFTTGRVKVKKGASNNPQTTNERESIPLETMLPSYEADDKNGLGEKAELEAELISHKNGCWSEGHHAYDNPAGPFGNSEKLNGISKSSSDEVSLPVNNHRKCLSSDVSDTSSEQKSTGEKLYFTEDNRKLCPGWQRVFVCGLILIILAVALLLGVLAATGILLAESESKNTRYESGHSLPSIDSVSHAGHSSRPRPSSSSSSSKVPQKVLPPVPSGNVEDNATREADTVSPPPTVSSKVPVLNDSSHSQTIVPNALVGEFTITDENFTEDLKDSTSHGYTSLATHLEAELRRIFKSNGGVFEELKILNFSPGSIKVKFVTVWASDRNIILSDKAVEILKSYLKRKNNLLLAFPVESSSIHFKDVFDECRVQKGGCSYNCIWDYNTLAKTCDCGKDLVLLEDGKSCGPKSPITTTPELSTTTVSSTYQKVSTSVTEPTLVTPSLETTTEQLQKEDITTTSIPSILTDAITSIIELFENLTSTENPMEFTETTTAIKNVISETGFSSNLETTTEPSTTEPSTTIATNVFTDDSHSHSTITEITTKVPRITNLPVFNDSDNSESPMFSSNSSLENATTFSTTLPTTVTTQYSAPSSQPSIEFVSLENSTDKFNATETFNNTTLEPHTTNFDILADSTATDLPSTLPSKTSEKPDETTIGYHIETEPIEVYTLKESIDFVTETVPVTNPEFKNVTDSFEVTTDNSTTPPTEANFSETNTQALIPDHITEPVLTTDFPELFVLTESVKYDTTTHPAVYDDTTQHVTNDITTQHVTHDTIIHHDFSDTTKQPVTYETTKEPLIYDTTKQPVTYEDTSHEIITEVSHVTDKTTNAGNLNHEIVTANDLILENATDITTSKDIAEYNISIDTTNEKIGIVSTTFETSSYEETVSTLPPVTTVLNIPIAPQSNRTPGLRSFDNFTDHDDNATFPPHIDILSTDATILVESTEVNAFVNNSTSTESNLETVLASPVTTPVHEELFPVTTSSNIDDSETTIINNAELSNQTIAMFSTESTIPAFTETIASANFSLENLHTTETTLETTTVESHSVSESTAFNDTLDTTILFNDSEASTLPTNTVKPLNETGILENTDTVLNVSITTESTNQNYTTEIITTLVPITNASIDGLIPGSTTEIPQTYSNTETPVNVENGTATVNFFETTVSNMETKIDTTTMEITAIVLDSESSTSNISETMTPTAPTLWPLVNGIENNTMVENNTETTILPTTNTDSEMNIATEEMFDNITIPPLSDNTTILLNFTETGEAHTLTTVQDFSFPTSTYFNESDEENSTTPINSDEVSTTVEHDNSTLYPEEILSNVTHTISLAYENPFDGIYSTLVPGMNETLENSTFLEDMSNFTTDGYDNVTNETTTNASTGIECREDQFLCEPLNICINDTFMCDGIQDCPDGYDEFGCKDTCHSNFMCTNSSTCIMSEVRCDGIWDCENGSDEENCTPSECAKHEVMCLDGSKCIKPGHICDWKYNCRDRSDEVGCVERTTCESGGRFFCNDGLCIPWSLKCDGEFDCKEGEDEGNCTCLSDEFQCNDGKCIKSSSRCDGRQDCHDAGDEMGCVTVDSEYIVSTYESYSGTWSLLCAEDWNMDDGQYLCQELGFGRALKVENVHVSFNGTWMAMRRDNLTDSSLWTERVSFVESCTSSLAARIECQKFGCGEYTGLLHRRKRDVISSSSTQWPFIGYASTFYTNKGCLSEILTPIWLITSAECLLSISKEPFNGSDWYVRTNIGRNVEADLAQNHEVLRIISHPHSSKFRSLTLRDYDVALIRLKHALQFVSDKIGAICPPEEQVPPGITCFSGVLGTEKPRTPPPQVLSINSLALQIIDKGNCNRVEHFNNTINQRMLCTQSSEGHAICDNDEGTPLMCLTGINKWFLAGMLTYQRFCDVYNKHPAVFSNLFSMRKFLDQVTGQKQYELPYDNSIYIIIPPTTPSPTMPETTTIAMTTTELTLLESTYPAMFDFENGTELGIFNGTTIMDEELGREENYTTSVPGEFTTQFPNFTVLYENETVPVHYGMEYDVINTTMEESDGILINKSHHDLKSLLNETYVESESNMTDVPIFDNSTSISSETTTNLYDLSNATADFKSHLDINATDGLIMSGELNMTEFINLSETEAYTGSRTLVEAESTTEIMKLPEAESTTEFMKFFEAEANTDFINPAEAGRTTMFGKPAESTLTTEFGKSAEAAETTEFGKPTEATVNTEFIKLAEATTKFLMPEDIGEIMELKMDDLDTAPEFKHLSVSNVTTVTKFDTSDMAINDTKNNSFPSESIINENESLNSSSVLISNDSVPIFGKNDTTNINQPMITMLNESSEINQPRLSNESIAVSQPLISMFNNSSEILMPFASNESIGMSQPLISMFNESSEMHLPFTSNESIAMSQPLISMFNNSSEMHTPFAPNESIDMSQPLISMFNESSEMHLPFASNESIAMSQPLISIFNESSEMLLPFVANENIDISKPFISNFSDSVEMHLPHLSNDTMAISQPFIPSFNESSEMFMPYISNESASIIQPFRNINESSEIRLPRLTDDNIGISQPLISLNDSIEGELENFTTVSSLEIFENNYTEITTKFQVSTNETTAFGTSIPFEITTTPNTPSETESSTTVKPLEDTTGNFTVMVHGEPETDLSISIFNHSNGMKFEPYVLSENKENSYEINNTPNTSIYEHAYITAEPSSGNVSFPLISEILSLSTEFTSNTTEFYSFANESESADLTTELEKVDLDYTTTAMPEIQKESKITTEFDVPYDSNTTLLPEVDTDVPAFTMKTHLISEKLTVIEDNSSLSNIAECGVWDENTGTVNTSSHNENFFMTWPSLGYLQIVPEPYRCASIVVAPTYVMTSLNCLMFRDSQLNPDKWSYVGGLYNPDFPSGGTQSHLVSKIIPYPDQKPPRLFYENNVALVRLKDSIKMDNFSKNACVPQESTLSKQECFSAGWTRNTSGNEKGREFFSVPVSILSSEECNGTSYFNGMLLDSLICGNHKHPSIQTCQMDLGSPLFCLNENKQWEVQGILNFAGLCGASEPTVFNNVAVIRKWIIETLTNDDKVQQ